MRFKIAVFAVISTCTTCSFAGGVAGSPIQQLDPVIVYGQSPFNNVDSATQGTVYSEEFQNRPLTRPAELLEVVPGLIVTQHSGEGKANQYFLRGFNLDHGTDFAQFVDDMPVNLPTHAHGQGYSDENFLIPELVDLIEYRKGPYYAQYGDFASAGAANIRYKDSLIAPIVQSTTGLNGYERLLAAGSSNAASGQLLYGIEGLHYDGPFVLGDHFNKASGVLRYSQKTDKGSFHIEALGYRALFDSTDQIASRAVTQGLITAFGNLDPSDAGSTYRYSLSATFDHQLAGGVLSASAYAIRYHLSLYSDFTYYLNDPTALTNPGYTPPSSFDPNGLTGQFNQLDTRNIYGGQVAYKIKAQLLGFRLDNELGLQARYDDIPASGLYQTQARNRIFTVLEDSVKEENIGIYGQSRVQITDWLTSTAGLRYSRFNADVDASIAANTGRATQGILSPKLSFVLGPFQKTNFFINLGKGFHSNDARGATENQLPQSFENPQGGQAATPATFLVTSRGADLGLRTALLPHTEFALSLFILDLDSELTIDGDNGTTGIGGATRRTGAESSIYWEPISHLVADADLAVSRARYRDPQQVGTVFEPAGTPYPANPPLLFGSYVAEAVDTVAAIGLTYSSPVGWDAALRLRYFGPRALNENDTARSNSTTLLNASLGYQFNSHFHVSLQGTNLFNSKDHDIDYYYVSRLRGEPAGGYADTHFHPVEPIDGRVVLLYAF